MILKRYYIDIINIALLYNYKQTKTNIMKQFTIIALVFASIVLFNLSAWNLI